MPNELLREVQQKFREVHRLHCRVIEKRVEETGVFRSQHMTLMFLSKNEGCSQKDIAEAHHISNAAVAVNLKRLEKAGLIERIIDSADNRCNRISITPAGRAVVEESKLIFTSINEQMYDELSAEEMRVFNTCLDKLRSKLITMEHAADKNQIEV